MDQKGKAWDLVGEVKPPGWSWQQWFDNIKNTKLVMYDPTSTEPIRKRGAFIGELLTKNPDITLEEFEDAVLVFEGLQDQELLSLVDQGRAYQEDFNKEFLRQVNKGRELYMERRYRITDEDIIKGMGNV